MTIFHLGLLHSFSKKLYALILFIFLHYSSSSIWIFCILSFFFLFSLLDHCLHLPTYHFSLFLLFLSIFIFFHLSFIHYFIFVCDCLFLILHFISSSYYLGIVLPCKTSLWFAMLSLSISSFASFSSSLFLSPSLPLSLSLV